MRRTGFKRPAYAPTRAPVTPIPAEMAQRILYTGAANAEPIPKPETLQHAGYMNTVRGLPCYRCGWPPRSQFCHSDEGKGERIKSDCRAGWPGCGPHYVAGSLVLGCHHDIGTARVLPKEQRRAFEAGAAAHTRATVRAMGLWPAELPAWPEDQQEAA